MAVKDGHNGVVLQCGGSLTLAGRVCDCHTSVNMP